MLPGMSEAKTALSRLIQRLKAIPEGEISATARRAGLPGRHLRRLREGRSPDVRLSTLVKLAAGLREPLGWVIDDGVPPAPTMPEKKLDLRVVRKLLRDVEKLSADAKTVAVLLPDEE
jgi:hypothetical protein